MKKISILLMALCMYNGAYSQITLTKDLTYGNNGAVDFSSNNQNLVWNRRYITSDNHVIVCPLQDFSSPAMASFITYDSNGSLLGSITLPAQGDASILYADNNAIYPVADGKLYKYSINGNLDSSFGNNGELLVGSNFSATNYLTVSYLSDGKILVRNPDSFTRYNSNGTVDTSYGNNGVVNISASSSSNPILNERINNNYFFENSDGRRKINIDTGSLDLSYGTNGYSVVSNVAGYVPFDPDAVTDNFEILTLLFNTSSSFEYAISKTKIDGHIDTAFGALGIFNLPQIFNSKILYYGLTMGIDDYNNKLFLPLTIRLQQGNDSDSKVGISCYSVATGNPIQINSSNLFETDILGNGNNISIQMKGNYLYLFTQTSVSRYIVTETSLNIKETKTDSPIYFSNPFTDQLSFHSKEKIRKVEIFDESGRLSVKSEDSDEINTTTLNKGIYFLKLTTDSNKIIIKKAIKN